MKTNSHLISKLLITLLILILSTTLYAQNKKTKYFEIGLSANFWTPLSSHLKATNNKAKIHINNNYMESGSLSGYGTSIAPAINLNYFFKKNLAISLGFSPLFISNSLHIQQTDSSFYNYQNEALIADFTLGITGKIPTSTKSNLYYGLGIDFVANYDFEQKITTEKEKLPDLEANGIAAGLYFRTGIQIQLNTFLSLASGLKYSFIPADLEYTNGGEITINEKTNLGGLALHTSLLFNF